MIKQKHFYLFRGLIREKRHWGGFIDELQKTFPDALITTIDIPGSGDYFRESSPLSILEMVERMRPDYLKSKKENEDSYLVAISLGGMISVEWMRHYPGDFKQATLVNTSFGGISPLLHRLLPDALVFLSKVFILKGREKEARILKLVSNHNNVFDQTLNEWEKIAAERPVSVQNTLRQLVAGARFKTDNFKPTIPVTLLSAPNDRMVSVECSRAIARAWKVPLREHPTGGHDLSVDDPQWLAQEIRASISALG